MKNTMGDKQSFVKTFDYLLVANTEPPFIAAITSWDEVYKGRKWKKDVIESKIKKSDLQFVTPETGVDNLSEVVEDVSFKQSIINEIKRWLSEINKSRGSRK